MDRVERTAEPKRASLKVALRHGFSLFLEKLLHWCIEPRLRAKLLRFLGAKIGRNVRIYEIQLFNLETGFRNLSIADDVHVGTGCRLDLAGPLFIGKRSTLAPGVTVLTHSDPGSSHGSKLTQRYPKHAAGAFIGEDCWLGANSTILGGVKINDLTVVGAGGVVIDEAPSGSVLLGVPAKVHHSTKP